ncbi:hypothetical protein [Nocardia arthritidis]|uniref:Uncharacterized protein n=1 Tax=Nocardia arthritidis TaxID=228602 RepID=A0A6G9YDP1_9NOCA|nr:hypothetical protein [Nocardia arthritidis]QIS11395.1 hypothetical protein F5544_17595 [Nocardia arthritidis]
MPRTVLVITALCLVGVLIASVVGAVAYRDAADRISAMDRAKTVVTATITDDPHYDQAARRYEAQVRWVRDGKPHIATAPVGNFAARGARAQIWLTPDGTPTDPPAPACSAICTATGTAIATFTALLFLIRVGMGPIRRRWLRNRSAEPR